MAARSFTRALAVAIGGVTVGCSGGDSPKLCDGVTDRQACFTDHYLHGTSGIDTTTCDGASQAKLGGKRELVFDYSATSGDGAAQEEGRLLQSYYAPYDLSFFTRDGAGVVPFESVLDGSNAEMRRRAGAEHLDVNSDDPEDKARLQRIAGDVIGKNLRDYILPRSQPPQAAVHVVVVSRILSDALASDMNVGGVIVGLGLSPKLLRDAASTDPSKNLFDLFGLPDDFTPVLFVGYADLKRLASGRVGEITIAHEMGHAMGLQHTTDPHNLMYPRVDAAASCIPGLSDTQVNALGDGTAWVVSRQAVVPHVDGAELAANVVHSLVDSARRAARTQP